MNNFCQQKPIENFSPENSLLKIFISIFFYKQIITVISLLLLSIPPIFAQEKFDQFFPHDSITVRDDSLAATIAVEYKRFPHDSSFKNIIWEMPKSVINQHFYEDPGDVLHYIPGVVLFDFGSSGQELHAGFHGANNRQVSIVFDDRPLYDPAFGGFDLNFLPVAFISKLSALSGLSSPQTVSTPEIISFSSDSYGEDTPYSQVSYHKAPNGYSDIDAVFGQRISKKMTLLLGGFIKSYDGKNESQSFEQQNFRWKIEYAISPRWNFQYSWLSNKLNRHILNPDLDDISVQLPNAIQKNNRIDHTLKINGRLFGSFDESFTTNVFYSSQESKIADKISNLRLNTPRKYFGLNLKNSFFILGQSAAVGGNFIHEKTD
ncbi:MAG TPA: Plug domain-containing protein, partial [bacterium]